MPQTQVRKPLGELPVPWSLQTKVPGPQVGLIENILTTGSLSRLVALPSGCFLVKRERNKTESLPSALDNTEDQIQKVLLFLTNKSGSETYD